MPTTGFPDGIHVGGGTNSNASKAGGIFALQASFDPTSASQISLGYLPKGAIPLEVYSLGGATGGTNPTVDIGTITSGGDDDGIANELDADAYAEGTGGALMGIALTEDTQIYGKVGASAATGGTTTVVVTFLMPAS